MGKGSTRKEKSVLKFPKKEDQGSSEIVSITNETQ